MVILIGGASHTGKTLLAQQLLEKYHYPYLSLDHLKMGLIRSGQTTLTPMDDDKLTDYLWPIVREMIKTVIENKQHLIVEGCYIPCDWEKDFPEEYLREIRGCFLIMSEAYIRNHIDSIHQYAGCIESRLDDSDLCEESLIRDNGEILRLCHIHGSRYILLENEYNIDLNTIIE